MWQERGKARHTISIHAPRMGSDGTAADDDVFGYQISIHAPRMGSDHRINRQHRPSTRFQSTLPAWGATRSNGRVKAFPVISIHAPRMGSDFFSRQALAAARFQSTLPAWGATSDYPERSHRNEFQSTLPAWGATNLDEDSRRILQISIHAPRMGSDRL